jgi:phosphoglycerate kinase
MMSHLDRPGGKRVEKLTLAPIAMRLGELLGKEVKFVDETVGQKVVEAAKDLKEGELLLLENTRFQQSKQATYGSTSAF